jgi:hypothetical protein
MENVTSHKSTNEDRDVLRQLADVVHEWSLDVRRRLFPPHLRDTLRGYGGTIQQHTEGVESPV